MHVLLRYRLIIILNCKLNHACNRAHVNETNAKSMLGNSQIWYLCRQENTRLHALWLCLELNRKFSGSTLWPCLELNIWSSGSILGLCRELNLRFSGSILWPCIQLNHQFGGSTLWSYLEPYRQFSGSTLWACLELNLLVSGSTLWPCIELNPQPDCPEQWIMHLTLFRVWSG